MPFEFTCEEPVRYAKAKRVAAMLALVAVVAALLLPFVDRAWTANDVNAATGYGPFSMNWVRFGFFHTYGQQIGPIALPWLDKFPAVAYVNHPPAMSWLIYAAGMEEWQMRLPSIVSLALVGVLLFRLLVERVGVLTGFGAGLLVVVVPTMSVHSQMSYELTVAALGLAMWLAHDRSLRAERFDPFSVSVVALCAFVGPWFDWPFLYLFCPALLILTWGRRGVVRGLAVPAISATIGLACLLVWRYVVVHADHLPKPPENQTALADIFARTWHEFSERPLTETLDGVWRVFVQGYTLPLLAIALLGLWPMFRRAPRLALMFAVGFAHPVMFLSHAVDHVMFFAYAAPFVACAAAMFAHELGRWSRFLQVGVLALAAGVPMTSTVSYFRATTTDFHQVMGRELTAAVEHENLDDEDPPLGFNVGHGWPYGAFLAYLPSIRVFPHSVRDPALLAAAVGSAKPRGVRYLWLRFGEVPAFATVQFAEPPGLAALLAPMPRRRIPELEGKIDVTGRGDVVVVTEAWMVTLSSP